MAVVAVAACADESPESDQVFVLSAVNGQMPALIDESGNGTWPFVMVVADTVTLRPDGTFTETTVTTLWNDGGAEGTLFSNVVNGTYQRPSGELVTFSPDGMIVGYTVASGNGGRLPGEGMVLDQRADVDQLTAGPDRAEFREVELE